MCMCVFCGCVCVCLPTELDFNSRVHNEQQGETIILINTFFLKDQRQKVKLVWRGNSFHTRLILEHRQD